MTADAPSQTKRESPLRPVDPDFPDFELIEEAVAVLKQGGVVAVPTDTVYGLAVDATNPEAVRKLHALKRRSDEKPIPLLIDSIKMFHALAGDLPEQVDDLLEEFWPGPLTLVVSRNEAAAVPGAADDTLGIRMPDNLVALGLINMLDRPLAVTSANLSGEDPCTQAGEVEALFGDAADIILDAGPTRGPQVSTVLALAETPHRILREGALEREALKQVLGDALE